MVPISLHRRPAVVLIVLVAGSAGVGCEPISTPQRSERAWGAACWVDEDCPPPEGVCEIARCNRGACDVAQAANGDLSVVQAAGDCRVIRCAVGGPIEEPDDADVPARAHDCVIDGCSGGAPESRPVKAGTACDDDGGRWCDGAGRCVECLSGDDCTEHVCVQHTCVPATCADGALNGEESDVDCGAPCGTCADGQRCETNGDCQSGVCTGGVVCTSACGDGVVNGADECDDGNAVSGDGCDANCTLTGCGNGVVTPGETCDDGNVTSGDGCDANCTPTGCGNGVVTAGETCDDGNVTSGDCCSSSCEIVAGCSIEAEPNDTCAMAQGPVSLTASAPSAMFHAVIDPVTDNDFFAFTVPVTATVAIETLDGSGLDACAPSDDTVLELLGPDCATLLAGDGDGGVASCSRIDGTLDPGARLLAAGTYYVHVGSAHLIPIQEYNLIITMTSYCSNGALEPSEGCDDGNLTSGDGCSASCSVETGYFCDGQPSQCELSCGDGCLNGTDQCDDGDPTSGDGCSSTCHIETDYQCTIGSSYQCAVVPTSSCSLQETFCNDAADNDDDSLTDQYDPDCEWFQFLSFYESDIPCAASGVGSGPITYRSVDVPRDIPDVGATTSTLTATRGGAILWAALFLGIDHGRIGDLTIRLRSPLGTERIMSSNRGGAGNGLVYVTFEAGCNPFGYEPEFTPGNYCFAPEQPLTGFDGEPAAGPWTLLVTDSSLQYEGSLSDWSIVLCVAP